MKVFYHGCAQLPDVTSESPVERSEDEIVLLLHKLRGIGSFLGLELDARFVLQCMYEQGAIHTELLDRESRSLEYCTLTIPLAEQCVRAACHGQPVKRVAQEAFVEWQHEQLA